MNIRIISRFTWLATLFIATSFALAQSQSLNISGLRQFYSSPYLLDFTFSIRDQDNRAVIQDLSQFQVACMENGQTISPSESGFRLLSGDTKSTKCFLVLDYTRSMVDLEINGDIDGDYISDSVEAMEDGAKTIIGGMHDDAQIGVFEFHRADAGFQPQKVTKLTVDKEFLTNQIDQIYNNVVWTSGSTRCWDALYLALSEYSDSNPADDQRFLVFLSDGKDESSTRTVNAVISLAQSKGTKIYCIGYGRELTPGNLQSITSQTGGQYYPAANVTELTQQFEQIMKDLNSQYTLRWTTLKRGSSSFTPYFELTYAGVKAAATAKTYLPSSYTGNELQGRLIFDTSISQSNVATLILRAAYMPRSITRLRLYFSTSKALTVQQFSYAEGGVCPTNWVFTVNQTNGTGYCEFSSPNPANPFTALPFAALGKLARFQLKGVTNLTQCFYELAADNSLYQQTGGQAFIIENGNTVTAPLSILPYGTPVAWLAKYGIINNLIGAELADPDGDGVPTWLEYATGTNPTNKNSAFLIANIKLENGTQIAFNTETNWIYEVDYSDNLNQWLVLRTGIVGTGNPITDLADTQAANGRVQRFYRLRATPKPFEPDTSKYAWIKPGAFAMGSPLSEVDRYDNEGPQTQVTISQGYWMSKYETTQEEYLAVMGNNPALFTGDLKRPVERVSWKDATNYCAKLTARERTAGRLSTGYAYRLPTEAEWEYACRAGTTTATAYGDSLSSTQANFDGNLPYGGAAKGPSLGKTNTVGSYAPNAWGLYDMHGNVDEWCLDWYGTYPGGSVTDPRGPATGSIRVFRGGSGDSSGRDCRSANRGSRTLVWSIYLGFRPVLAPGQ